MMVTPSSTDEFNRRNILRNLTSSSGLGGGGGSVVLSILRSRAFLFPELVFAFFPMVDRVECQRQRLFANQCVEEKKYEIKTFFARDLPLRPIFMYHEKLVAPLIATPNDRYAI
jgi:hypothetical protein